MYQSKPFMKNVPPKVAIATVAGIVIWFGSGAIGFPPIYQAMFVVFLTLGTLFMIALDLPAMKETTGSHTAANFIIFYMLISAILYGLGAAMPQYNPKYEIIRLFQIPGQLTASSSKEEFLKAGRKLFVDYECSNCHIAEKQGGSRGPNLDETDMGDLKTIEASIIDPRALIKPEYDKPKMRDSMPDDYGNDLKGVELKAVVMYMDLLSRKFTGKLEVVTADKMPDGWWTNEEIFKKGKAIYEGRFKPEVNCSVCHGKEAVPLMTGAFDFRDTAKVDALKDAEWYTKVADGKPGTPMPAWKPYLAMEDIWAVISYTHSFSRGGKMEARPAE